MNSRNDSRAEIRAYQKILKDAGLYGGLLDGDWGPLTQRAHDAYVKPKSKAAKSIDLEALRAEYQHLYDTMVARWEDNHEDEPGLEAIYKGLRVELIGVVRAIKANKARYQQISARAGGNIPWQFIALIHNLECGLSFNKHLHNGDPLTRRTVLVPAGRPRTGNGPFTFEESAVDALTMPGKAYHLATDWSLPATLHRLEGYNGFGYRRHHPETLSPYLWSGSNHYTRGKYVADGVWSASAVSKQLGTALILKALGGIS